MGAKPLNEKLLILAKAKDLTQSRIASEVGMQPSHINRYFNGASDITSGHFVDILRVLGIDVEKQTSEQLKVLAGLSDHNVSDLNSGILFLFNTLDEIGKQTMLKHLYWVAEKTSKKKIPEQVTYIIQKEVSKI